MVMLVLDSTTSHSGNTNPSATLNELQVAFIPQNMWDWKYELQEKLTLDNAVQQAVVQWFRKQFNSLQTGQAKMCIRRAPVQIPVTYSLTVAVLSTVSILERVPFIYTA
jgi:hypothetical protein